MQTYTNLYVFGKEKTNKIKQISNVYFLANISLYAAYFFITTYSTVLLIYAVNVHCQLNLKQSIVLRVKPSHIFSRQPSAH